jgi:UDPglucose 6-dehydrogenase
MSRIAVIGVGRLGLCFALNLERAGIHVWGIETHKEYLASLQNGTFESPEPEVNTLLAAASYLHLTDSLSCIVENDISDIFIMVATPSADEGSYDHGQIERVAHELKSIGNPLEMRNMYIGCTTMPGYCDTLAAAMAPHGYTVSYNPEFIAQGSIIRDQLYPDQVLIGEASIEVGDRLEAIYRRMVHNNPRYCRMDRLSAEITKIATNCFLTTKISFANSIGDLATKAGADPTKILSAIGADSRIGSKYLNYGFGFGGPCFPRDNRALGKFGDDQGYELLISKATDEVNRRHIDFQFSEYTHNSGPIVFHQVSYKKDSTIIEESQQLALAVRLAKAGRQVIIRERVEVIRLVEQAHPGLFTLEEQNSPA